MAHFIDDRAGLVTDTVDGLPQAEPAALCQALGLRLGRATGGSSGVLTSIVFAATGSALAGGAAWPEALERGAERMRVHGGAAPGDRTLLDALVPAVEALRSGGLAAAAGAARAGARATAAMERAATGRSSYLAAANLAGHEDPSAFAAAAMFEALAGA